MRLFLPIVVILATIALAPLSAVSAQSQPPVQELRGSLAPGQTDVFLLASLKKGQTLDAFMENSSGNLDPILSVLSADQNLSATLQSFNQAVTELLATSPTPLIDLPMLRDKYTLAWDDDSGPGHSAALKFTIPRDGDYYLLAAGSLSSVGRSTAGNYRLVVGLDAVDVLKGIAQPTGAAIAVQQQSALASELVQDYTGTISVNNPSATIKLNDLNPGDTLYAYVEATSGNLKPGLMLRDFSDKPLNVSNLSGQANYAAFMQVITNGGANYTLQVIPVESNGQITTGDFHLQVGINAPPVLAGLGHANTQSLLKLAIPVQVGLKLQQIISIDQPNEIMNDVGTLKLDWTDPALAFNPDGCNCITKLYTEITFNNFINDINGKWPDFTFYNQQGNRWSQNRVIEVGSDGHVSYVERFTTAFQLNFDWTAFPFDRQDFYLKIDLLDPVDEYYFVPMQDFNEIDPNNGEDEFILTGFDAQITSEIASRTFPTSRFTFHFSAPRHQDYYIFRIFIPVLLIISVSYITFFLKDYTRRIEIATGNLLLFIAFSFSLGENYPRMGYLTFLDAIMAITFIINTLVVVLNVYLKWLEQKDQRERADRLEAPLDIVYPVAYLIAFGIAALIFLR